MPSIVLITLKSSFPVNVILFYLKLRSPRGELHELRVGAVVVSLILVERGDLRHLVVCESEVEDVEVILDVSDVFAAGDDNEAHLRMPAQNDLSGSFSVLLAELGKDRLLHQALVAVTERIPRHQTDAVFVERFSELLLCEIGVRLNLNELRHDFPFRL